ncbi:ABC transporter permease [Lewinella sp. LCG006]|uniref:ABC transporter permease n=1 Tax=Lewinella sp. LCG006 TaxID=3231911 RepID=UPI0034606D51
MLRNYFKLALKVLGRNKFFTGISLFGISFTLLILMVITAFYDAEFGKNPPLSEKGKMVIINRLQQELVRPDTTWTIDSTLVDGLMTYDSTYEIGEAVNSTSISNPSYKFLDDYLRDLDGVSQYTFFSPGHDFNVFLENRKISVAAIYTDDPYWEIFDFHFTNGAPFGASHLRDASQVAVMTSKLAREYFGDEEKAINQEIEIGNRSYRVIGLVENAHTTSPMVAADIFLPLSTMEDQDLEGQDFLGNFNAVYLAENSRQMPLIKSQITSKVATIAMPNPEEYNRMKIIPINFGEWYASEIVNQDDPAKGLQRIRLVFGLLLLFFILLPTLNLINMNLSRIMEREAEIGVRKAFGAYSGTILYQFVFENIIITFIGGIIGMVLAVLVLYLINDSQILPEITLGFNMRVFFYSIFICLGFGILSGLLPAWKVSRLQIADVLKSNQL